MMQPLGSVSQRDIGYDANTNTNTGSGNSAGNNPLSSVTQVEAKKNVLESASLSPDKNLEQRNSANHPESSSSDKITGEIKLKIIDRSEWIDNHAVSDVVKKNGYMINEVEIICFGISRYQEHVKIIGRLSGDYFFLSAHVECDPEGMGPDIPKYNRKNSGNIEGLLEQLNNNDLDINLLAGSSDRKQVVNSLLDLRGRCSLQPHRAKELKKSCSDVAEKSPHKNEIVRAKQILNNNPSLGSLELDERIFDDSFGRKTTTLKSSLEIIDPNLLLLAAEAAYYKEKYAIDIKIIIFDDMESSLYRLIEKEKLDNGSAIGVVFGSGESGHVTPIIIIKKANKTYFIVSDSIDDPNRIKLKLCYEAQKIKQESGKDTFTVVSASFFRQADSYSCRHDAILFLKDALNRKEDFIEYLMKSFRDCEVELMESGLFKYYSAEIPPFLYKTMQRKAALDALTNEQLQTPLKKSQAKTLKTHLDKYRESIDVEIKHERRWQGVKNKCWQVNTFLQTKPYQLLNRAFKQLTDDNGKIDPQKESKIRSEYIIRG